MHALFEDSGIISSYHRRSAQGVVDHQVPLLLTWFNFNPNMDKWLHHYKMWGEIMHQFLNFNDATVEVYEWISNFIPHLTGTCDYLSMLGLKLIHVSKVGPRILHMLLPNEETPNLQWSILYITWMNKQG